MLAERITFNNSVSLPMSYAPKPSAISALRLIEFVIIFRQLQIGRRSAAWLTYITSAMARQSFITPLRLASPAEQACPDSARTLRDDRAHERAEAQRFARCGLTDAAQPCLDVLRKGAGEPRR